MINRRGFVYRNFRLHVLVAFEPIFPLNPE